MHICFVSQEYPTETGWGGIGAYTHEMAHGLVRAGHRVTVVSASSERESVSNQGGIQVYRVLPGPDWSRWRGLWRLNRIWPGFAWKAARKLTEIHARFPIDVVEAAECRADSLFVPLLRNRPKLVVRLHTAQIFVDRLNRIQPRGRQRLSYATEALAMRSADLLTAPSQAVVDLTGTWLALGQSSVRVVPNPVDTTAYSPGTRQHTGEVLVVGRLELRKGISTLVQAVPIVLQQCPQSSFRFVGSDGQDSSGRSWRARLLEAAPAEQHHRLHFERVDRDQLVERYRQADICVLPSIWENFPYALLEAMACGMPVVATRRGGFPELIENGVNGVLVPPHNPAALADALSSILSDPVLRERMGSASRARAEKLYSVDRVVPRMLAIYENLANGRNDAGN